MCLRIIGGIRSPPAALDGSHEERAAKVSSSVISIEQRELSCREGGRVKGGICCINYKNGMKELVKEFSFISSCLS